MRKQYADFTTMTSNGQKPITGFTLMEIMVVTIIIGTIAFTFSGGLDRLVPIYRLNNAMREISFLVRNAKLKAQSANDFVFLQFDLQSGRYWLLAPDKKEGGDTTYKRQMVSVLPNDVEFAGVIRGRTGKETYGKITHMFDPYGIAAPFIINVRLKSRQNTVKGFKYGGFTGSTEFLNAEGTEKDIYFEELREDTEG